MTIKLLVSREWLRNHILTDEDVETDAGSALTILGGSVNNNDCPPISAVLTGLQTLADEDRYRGAVWETNTSAIKIIKQLVEDLKQMTSDRDYHVADGTLIRLEDDVEFEALRAEIERLEEFAIESSDHALNHCQRKGCHDCELIRARLAALPTPKDTNAKS